MRICSKKWYSYSRTSGSTYDKGITSVLPDIPDKAMHRNTKFSVQLPSEGMLRLPITTVQINLHS